MIIFLFVNTTIIFYRIRILEALETVGEAEMLKKLEESIMGGTVPMCNHSSSSTIAHGQPSTSKDNHHSSAQIPSSTCRPTTTGINLLSSNNSNTLIGRVHFPPTASSTFSTNTILRHPPLASSSVVQLPPSGHQYWQNRYVNYLFMFTLKLGLCKSCVTFLSTSLVFDE